MAGGVDIDQTAPSHMSGLCVVTITGEVGHSIAVEAGITPNMFITSAVTAGRQTWMEKMGVSYGLLSPTGVFTIVTGSVAPVRPIDSLKEFVTGDLTLESGANAGFMLGDAFKDASSQLVCWR